MRKSNFNMKRSAVSGNGKGNVIEGVIGNTFNKVEVKNGSKDKRNINLYFGR
jgi:hypothetical protein